MKKDDYRPVTRWLTKAGGIWTFSHHQDGWMTEAPDEGQWKHEWAKLDTKTSVVVRDRECIEAEELQYQNMMIHAMNCI